MGNAGVDLGLVEVTLTRHELTALREAIELTPNFPGRPAARDGVLAAIRTRRQTGVVRVPLESARGLAAQLVPSELSLVLVRAKFRRAIDAATSPLPDLPDLPDLPAASAG